MMMSMNTIIGLLSIIIGSVIVPITALGATVSSGFLFPSDADALARNPAGLGSVQRALSIGGGYAVMLGNSDANLGVDLPLVQNFVGAGFDVQYTPVSHSYRATGGIGFSTAKSLPFSIGVGTSAGVIKTLDGTRVKGDLALRLDTLFVSGALGIENYFSRDQKLLNLAVGSMPGSSGAWCGELCLTYGMGSKQVRLKPGARATLWNSFSISGGFSAPVKFWSNTYFWTAFGVQFGRLGIATRFEGQFSTVSGDLVWRL